MVVSERLKFVIRLPAYWWPIITNAAVKGSAALNNLNLQHGDMYIPRTLRPIRYVDH